MNLCPFEPLSLNKMTLSQVKLVVTDMDGTLLNHKDAVSDRFYELFEALDAAGIHFVAASGRQYASIYQKLIRIAHRITIIAENGSLARRNGEELLSTPLPQDRLKSIIDKSREIPRANTVLCTKDKAYVETRDYTFISMFREYYPSYERIDDLHEVDPSEVIKVAMHHRDNSERHIYPHVREFENDLQLKVSGLFWVDISHPLANKGVALKHVQRELNILPEETMSFGDYHNDLEMLQQSNFSFAMANAHPDIKKAARYTTLSNDEGGVEHILDKLLKAKKTV